ncbi:ATP-binding protein [Tahibacter sp.]|uniref:AAA family ATPase n=1 Tax=Tahibacter sp. TaxID=2056211 RepID=UPI0028C4EAEA|nr:ATP-binding protein [Tahibacter sp.]
MENTSAYFNQHACFRTDWAGFDEFLQINVVIGRNNTGKSQLLDLVKELCNTHVDAANWPVRRRAALQEIDLRNVFREGKAGDGLVGDHWRQHGEALVGALASWTTRNGEVTDVQVELRDGTTITDGPRLTQMADRKMLARIPPPFSGRAFRHLLADRDIRPEPAVKDLSLEPDGAGATNLIRKFITSSSLPKDVIQRELLDAVNSVFRDDGIFTSLDVRQHDEADKGGTGHWEVFLGEAHKGQVALSKSGSGLKTVILVLLNLIVFPKIPGRPQTEFVFAFEELENNLHPALLRRLIAFVESHALKTRSPVFLTTHSPVMIDMLGSAPHAQITHVVHDGKTATTKRITAHFDRLDAISTLGARPSDLLQANGIVWVEGPSDRVYMNRWISLVSNGELSEGRHYQCAFYGGALLARYQVTTPDVESSEFSNLLRINPNIVLVCDSDLSTKRGQLKERVQRTSDEVRQIPRAIAWVTDTKEIENYLTGQILTEAFGIHDLPDPSQYEFFFPAKEAKSYLETRLQRKSIDKVELAERCAPFMTIELLTRRFDWKARMNEIVAAIRAWNA